MGFFAMGWEIVTSKYAECVKGFLWQLVLGFHGLSAYKKNSLGGGGGLQLRGIVHPPYKSMYLFVFTASVSWCYPQAVMLTSGATSWTSLDPNR
jgi:hypothetical protein